MNMMYPFRFHCARMGLVTGVSPAAVGKSKDIARVWGRGALIPASPPADSLRRDVGGHVARVQAGRDAPLLTGGA